jgi:ribosomal protein S18 acetylase RimI-like enzyme
MSESCFMPDIKLLVPDDWRTLRTVRLAALQESPEAFLATYEAEREFDEARWRAEFDRGAWIIGLENRTPVSVLGCTRAEDAPPWERYLEYLWVAPECRRTGVASGMLRYAIGWLRERGVRRALLWVLDGNDAAVRLYKRAGFVSSSHSQPLPGRPGRTEERMQFDLD